MVDAVPHTVLSKTYCKNKYHYYRCIRSDASRTTLDERCESKSVKGPELEQLVWDEICKLLQEPSRLKQELVRQNQKENIDEKLRLAHREEANIDKQINRLIDLYTDEVITKEELDRRLPNLRNRQEKQSLEIKKFEQDQLTDDALQDAQMQLEELAHIVQSQLSTADWNLKRELCLLLVKRIEIHDQEIKIVMKAPNLPFDRSPDENRGFLHQRLPCVAQPKGLGARSKGNRRVNGPNVCSLEIVMSANGRTFGPNYQLHQTPSPLGWAR